MEPDGLARAELTQISTGRFTRCYTAANHYFHPYDHVQFTAVRAAGKADIDRTPGRSASGPRCRRIEEINELGPLLITDVRGPREFIVKLDSLDCEEDGFGGVAAVPVNMYKLCSEVVIPATICTEKICRVIQSEDLTKLSAALASQSDFTLLQGVQLSTGLRLPAGLTLHGRLALNGYIRKLHWEATLREAQSWFSSPRRNRDWEAVRSVDAGASELENKLQDFEKVAAGDYLVFRSGKSFAEICHEGLAANAYVSHFWGQPCIDLLKILQHYADTMAPQGSDPAYWICTFANNQHRVDLGSHWKKSPFYQGMCGLTTTGGSVLMAMDSIASTLTRIWCIFEIYVCAELNLPLRLFSPDGDLSQCQGRARAKSITERITQLDFRRAEASVAADKSMILKAIEDLDGGLERVEWTVKQLVSDFASFLYASHRAEHPVTGEPLSLNEEEGDMFPCRIRGRTWSTLLRRKGLSLEAISQQLQGGALFVLEGPGGSGKSVVSKALAKHAMKSGVLSLRVPVSQLAKVWEDHSQQQRSTATTATGRSNEDLLVLWGRRRFGKAATRLAKPKDPIILILDGLDEAGNQREAIMSWLKHHVRHRENSQIFKGILVTFRYPEVSNRSGLLRLGFSFLEIEPLSLKDVVKAARNSGQEWRVSIALGGKGLKAELWDRPLMAALFIDLVSTGARLATIDEIGILRYFFEKLLPPDCEALQQTLTGRAAGSGSSILDNPMDVGEEQLKRILMKLAWLKTVDGSRIIQEEDLRRAFAACGLDCKVQVTAFWHAASQGQLRLLDHGEGFLQFLHLRLQDFLASEYLWSMGDWQALRCVSGAGYRGEAADDARYKGARRLLVELLRDGSCRSEAPDSNEAWYLLCCAAMSNSVEGVRCALRLTSQSPDAAWQVLGRTVFAPLLPYLKAAPELVSAARWSDMFRLLNWNGALANGTLGMGAAGGPSVVAIVVLCLGWPRVHLQYVWLLHVFVGLSGFLWMAWLGLVLQLLFLYYGRLGGNVYSLLVLFRFDWDCYRLHIMGYGRVKLRADDVNFNLILYMGFWKGLLVPPFWAMWAWTRFRNLILKCIFVFLGLLMGNICTLLHTAIGILCAFPLEMIGMYCLLPAHCLFQILCSAASGHIASRIGTAVRSALPAQIIGSCDEEKCTPSSSRESSRGVMPAIRAQDLLRAGLDFWTQKPAEQSPETLHSVTPSPEDLSPTDRLLRALRRSYSRQPQDTDELCCQCFPGKLI